MIVGIKFDESRLVVWGSDCAWIFNRASVCLFYNAGWLRVTMVWLELELGSRGDDDEEGRALPTHPIETRREAFEP